MASVLDTIGRCEPSRESRRQRYGLARLLFLRGTDTAGPRARFNKLKAHFQELCAYLYAPDTTRFGIELPVAEAREWLEQADRARQAFLRMWRDSGSDVEFVQQVLWTPVYGTTITKILPDKSTVVSRSAIFPGDFGVGREDILSLDHQQEFCHWYSLSMPEIEALTVGLEKRAGILAWAKQHASPELRTGGALPNVLQQVLVSNTTGNFFGSGTSASLVGGPGGSPGEDSPATGEPLVECVEVWEQREFLVDPKQPRGRKYTDYWVTTVIGEWPIIERRNPVLPHVETPMGPDLEAECPFVALRTEPLADMFWGVSELLGLAPLQKWRETRMGQIDQIFALQLDPPRFFSGVAIPDEKLKALRSPGGYASTPNPGAKVDELKPDMPTDAFQVIDQIDRMFAAAGHMKPILQGENDAGVRAGNQLGTLAGIAAGGPIREQALLVEDALETLATRMFHLQQRRDDTAYPLASGKHFLLSQLPSPCTVKVSAHSSSPVYAEQVMAKAKLLHDAKAIDLETLVDLTDPPNREELKEKARMLQQQQAEMAQKVLAIKEEQARRGKSR
jgi:hypothetical protein